MWIYLTGDDGGPGIVLYNYKPGRKGEYAKEFLKGFSGFFHCDGYQGYNSLEDVTRVGCIAHLRRKFFDAIPVNKSEGAHNLPAEIGVRYLNQLFEVEKKLKDYNSTTKKEKRLKLEAPIFDNFWKWVESLNPVSGSKLDKAVIYAKNQRKNIENVFQYLKTLLLYMPDYINEPEGIEKLMPWSEFIQATCPGPHTNKPEIRLKS